MFFTLQFKIWKVWKLWILGLTGLGGGALPPMPPPVYALVSFQKECMQQNIKKCQRLGKYWSHGISNQIIPNNYP